MIPTNVDIYGLKNEMCFRVKKKKDSENGAKRN